MKNLILLILILHPAYCFPQWIRVGVGSGFGNYSGDIQQAWVTTKGAYAMFSTGASIDLNKHLLIRGEANFSNLGADDKRNGNPALISRNLNFKTSLVDFSTIAEYNLLSLQNYRFTPYFFGGLGVFHFNPFTKDSTGGKIYLKPLKTEGQSLSEYPDRKPYKLTQFNLSYGAGLKWAMSDDIYIGMELSLRKLFTDYLDDVSISYVDKDILLNKVGSDAVRYSYRGGELKSGNNAYPNEFSKRGNPNFNDSYYFVRIRLEVKMAWYRNEDITSGNISSHKKSLKCPF